KGLDVLDQFLLRERGLADPSLDDPGLFDAEFDGAPLGPFDGIGDVHRHGANLWVRHDTARAKHLPETADQRHQVGGGNAAIEVDLAFAHLFNEVFRADNVCSAAFASSALAPRANTPTRRVRPEPFGNVTTPRTIWSACVGSTPRFIAISMVSSNFALARSFTSLTASAIG